MKIGRLLRLVSKWWRRLAIAVVLLSILAFYVGVPLVRVLRVLHPPRSFPVETPASRGLAYEDVTFPSTDGIKLSGWYIPSHNRAAVILTHGLTSNRGGVLDQAEVLAKAGFGVLLYDLRAHGN